MPKLGRVLRELLGGDALEHFNVTALVRDELTGLTRVHLAHNIVTDAGDVHVAQRAAGESATNTFTPGSLYLATAISPALSKTSVWNHFTAIGSTEKTNESGYPKTNDSDTDNSGKATDAITRKYLYSAASFSNSAISHGYIAASGASGAAAIYAGWAFSSSINKTASDTLTVYHNTTANGV